MIERREKPRRSLRDRIRLGITARLSISFLGVAVLILAANVLVEQGILVERTTRLVPVAPPPAPAPVLVARPTPPPAEASPPPAAAGMSPLLLEEALAALAQFEQASDLRMKSPSASVDAQYKQAGARLNDAVKRLVGNADSPLPPATSGRIRTELRTYTAQADALIQNADDHAATESSRTALLENLSARVKETLATAWTIFGRVVARQTLVVLSDDLDSLRAHSEALQPAVPLTAAQLAAVTDAEQRVQQTLASNAAAFRRAQGDPWYQAMETDLTKLIALREKSIQLSTGLTDGTQALADQGMQIRHFLFAGAHAAAAAAAVAPKAAASQPPAATPAVALPVRQTQTPPPVERRTLETRSITSMPAGSSSRRLIASVSAAAALIMVIMCIGIVLSIVTPVRRLVRAASQIAAGKYSLRVATDGITELDALATAFNTMAEELARAKAASQQYQEGLEEKIQERTRRLQELSERDPLTGLPNRRHLFAMLDAAIECARTSGHCVGVLFVDVDNFKNINDGLGHAFGDNVLTGMGARLAELSRFYGFAARLGGDEFTVIVDHAMTIEEIETAGEGIVAAFQKPLIVEGRELVVSVSVGASAYPAHAQQAAALLKAADMALFRAKALGRSQLSVFTSELAAVAAAKFATEQGLRRAIERNEFELFFQPEINAETLEIGLVEALIRWRTSSGELVLPGAFLAVADESGLAVEIGDWVLRSAISAAAFWHRGPWPEVCVAINVSSRQFANGNFVGRVQALLEEFELPPRCIEIELTETVLQTEPSTVECLKSLRELGVAIALDDFGTGFSSLASLESLPLTRVKLDRSLISGIDVSPRSAAIAEAIIGMCRRLSLEVTAEGVERPEQFAYLVRQRSMFIQGFLLAEPVPLGELAALVGIVKARARELLITARETAVTAAEFTQPPRQLSWEREAESLQDAIQRAGESATTP
jgi:diguanylate cyclase (GGDEF)-like protein